MPAAACAPRPRRARALPLGRPRLDSPGEVVRVIAGLAEGLRRHAGAAAAAAVKQHRPVAGDRIGRRAELVHLDVARPGQAAASYSYGRRTSISTAPASISSIARAGATSVSAAASSVTATSIPSTLRDGSRGPARTRRRWAHTRRAGVVRRQRPGGELRHAEGRGARLTFEGDTEFPQVGVSLFVLAPGEPMGIYHWEADQEDFLVLSGEALLIVEGDERPAPVGLRPLPGADQPRHRRRGRRALRRARVGAREHQRDEGVGRLSSRGGRAAPRRGVERETNDAAEAYAGLTRKPTACRDGWLPDGERSS